MAGSRHPRARLTVLAAALSAVLAVPYLYVAVDLGLVVFGDRQLDAHSARELATLGYSSQETSNLIAIAFFALVFLAVYAVLLSVGLFLRHQWARHGAILTYIFFAVVMLPLAVAGFTADPPAANAWLGILLGLADLSIPVVLLSNPVSDDFGDMEWYRDREEHRPLPPDPHMVAGRG